MQFGLQRHGEAHPESGQEVPPGVAVPDKGMHHAHAAGVGVEVEAHHEGQPAAPFASGAVLAVPPFQPHHGAHGSALFKDDGGDLAGEGVAAGSPGAFGHAVLQEADQPGVPGNRFTMAGEAAEQGRPDAVDHHLQCTRVYGEGVGTFGDGN